MDNIVAQTEVLTSLVIVLRRDVAQLTDRVSQLEAVDTAHGAWHAAQNERSFWQRLRWLVAGK